MSPLFPVGLYLPQNVAPARVLGWARAAEAAGLHGLWLPDHLHQFPDTRADRLEAWMLLSAVAAETSAIRLGIGVCNVQLRNPALLAKMAFTLDNISGGRLDLTLGTGGNRREIAAYGYRPATGPAARRMLADAALAIRALEGGGPATAPAESSARFADAHCHPTPVQRPFPLAIAADHPETMRLVARHADCWYANLATPDVFAERNARLTEIARAEGRDPDTLQRSAHLLAIVGGTEDAAHRAADVYAAGPRARLFAVPHIIGDAAAIRDGLAAYRAAGADRAAVYILNLPACSDTEGADVIRVLADGANAL